MELRFAVIEVRLERSLGGRQAIGAGAIDQPVKALAISRAYVAPGGIDLVFIPSFIDIASNDGEERTGIGLLVEAR